LQREIPLNGEQELQLSVPHLCVGQLAQLWTELSLAIFQLAPAGVDLQVLGHLRKEELGEIMLQEKITNK
jgi:hypothetical protein